MLISPVLFIVMQGAAMPREGKRRRFHIFYPDLLWQPVTGRCSGSVWPRPPDESIRWRPFRQLSLCWGTTSVPNHLRLIFSNVPSAMISFIAVLNFEARAVSSFRRPIPTPGPNSPPEIRGP